MYASPESARPFLRRPRCSLLNLFPPHLGVPVHVGLLVAPSDRAIGPHLPHVIAIAHRTKT